MLSKLLKYELRASGRILLPVYALLLGLRRLLQPVLQAGGRPSLPYRCRLRPDGAADDGVLDLRSGHRRHHGAADDLSVL